LLIILGHSQTHHVPQDPSERGIGPSQRFLPGNTKHSQETGIHATAGFENPIPASEGPQTRALSGTVTGIGPKVHMFRHNNDYPYSCIFCGKGFGCPSDLTEYERAHTGERPYVCDVSDMSFTQKGSLKTHQRIHTGERPYICDVCSRSFSLKSSLTVHQVTHTEERPFVCDACNKSFGCRKHLSSHISLYCVKSL
jgi:uncharacterized Zn-finger protein